MKKTTILTAQSIGYFRAKDSEKREILLGELMELEDFTNVSRETITEILESEVLRRHVVYQNRAQKSFDKIEADAAKPLTGGVDSAHGHVTEYGHGNYVLTVAQNNTDVDLVFMACLKRYCEANNAKLLVAKMTYNKNGFQQSQDVTEGVYYDPAIVAYLVEGQISLGNQIQFIGQANVLPTAKNPLVGFESITPVGVSVIIPASKIALKCTSALKGGKSKILFSTGSITKRNYIMRKAGAVAASEHSIGALFVSVADNGEFMARQLELMPDSQGFYDEGVFYSVLDSVGAQSPVALQFGDIHAEKMEDENLAKMQILIDKYMPYNIILHDVMDFSSRNHHNIKDCAFMFAQDVNRKTVRQDIQTVSDIIQKLTRDYLEVHIIESNHDVAINTWLKTTDFKDDPTNATIYLECMLALYEHIEKTGHTGFNMLEYVYCYVADKNNDNVTFHNTDDSVIMAGVEMGCHGHVGANGSRGSPAQFRTLGIALNTGHTHTPSILGGAYTAGVTGSLEMGYNIGASSWRLANILTWPNGQRQIIFM